MVHSKFLSLAMLLSLCLFAAGEVSAQSDVISKRQQLMKSQSANAKAIKAAVESKDYATIETKAKEIMGTSEKIPDLFPKGSTAGKTKAKADIWENSKEFKKYPKDLHQAASELAAAAKTKDDAAITTKVKALGEVCTSCHKGFRASKYSE